MYHPVFFEMVSGSIATEKMAAAECQRTMNALSNGPSTGWITGVCQRQPWLARGLQMLSRRASAPAQPRIEPAAEQLSGR